MARRRSIIRIDEEKCDGCGQCAIACAEGAIEIVDGKARLVSETYCDGLGACIGECPQGAITIEVREAEEFDEEAVQRRLAELGREPAEQAHAHAEAAAETLACGCPSALSATWGTERPAQAEAGPVGAARPSQLRNWPVQLYLVPPTAPYLEGAELVIAADCTAFALADFNERFLPGRKLLVGCPKLDDAALHRHKLGSIFGQNDIRSIEVVYMEVPCCSGLVRLVRQALADAGKQIPVRLTRIGIHGDVQETVALEPAPA